MYNMVVNLNDECYIVKSLIVESLYFSQILLYFIFIEVVYRGKAIRVTIQILQEPTVYATVLKPCFHGSQRLL